MAERRQVTVFRPLPEDLSRRLEAEKLVLGGDRGEPSVRMVQIATSDLDLNDHTTANLVAIATRVANLYPRWQGRFQDVRADVASGAWKGYVEEAMVCATACGGQFDSDARRAG